MSISKLEAVWKQPLWLAEFTEVKNLTVFTLGGPVRPRLRQVDRNGKDEGHDALMDTQEDYMSKRHEQEVWHEVLLMQDIHVLQI